MPNVTSAVCGSTWSIPATAAMLPANAQRTHDLRTRCAGSLAYRGIGTTRGGGGTSGGCSDDVRVPTIDSIDRQSHKGAAQWIQPSTFPTSGTPPPQQPLRRLRMISPSFKRSGSGFRSACCSGRRSSGQFCASSDPRTIRAPASPTVVPPAVASLCPNSDQHLRRFPVHDGDCGAERMPSRFPSASTRMTAIRERPRSGIRMARAWQLRATAIAGREIAPGGRAR